MSRKPKIGILITVGEKQNFKNFDIDEYSVRRFQLEAGELVEKTIFDYLEDGK